MELFFAAIAPTLTALITGLGIWRIQHIISKMDAKRDALEQCREEYQLIMLRTSNASISLGEATAKALRDGHANGEVTKALEYAQAVKHEQKEWLQKQSIKHII
jgi:hypothetical protein